MYIARHRNHLGFPFIIGIVMATSLTAYRDHNQSNKRGFRGELTLNAGAVLWIRLLMSGVLFCCPPPAATQ